MALRGVCTSNRDGSTATSATVTLTFPAGTVAGDRIACATDINAASGTVTAASGANTWAANRGPDNQSNVILAYLFTRTLDSVDVAAGSVTFTWNSTGRPQAQGVVFTAGDTATPFGTAGEAQAAASSLTQPAVTTTVAGSDVGVLVLTRVISGTAATVTLPTGWTKDGNSASNFGSGANINVAAGHLTTPGAVGSYGGGNITTSPAASHMVAYTVEARASTSATSAASGTTAATSTVAGAVSAILLAAGTVAGISSVSGDATRVPQILQVSGAVAATSTVTGAVTSRLPASATASATSATAGAVTAILPTSGTIAATSGVTGSPSIIGGPAAYPAAGTVAAVTGASGAVTARLVAAGSASATSTTSGAVTAVLRASGTVAALTGTAGDLTSILAASGGVVAATSGTTGDVTVIPAPVVYQAAGTVAAVSGTSGAAIRLQPSVDVHVRGVVDRSRTVTFTERPRQVAIVERGRTVTITDRSE